MTNKTEEEMALSAIEEHLAQGDWGNAERVLRSYAADVANDVVSDRISEAEYVNYRPGDLGDGR